MMRKQLNISTLKSRIVHFEEELNKLKTIQTSLTSFMEEMKNDLQDNVISASNINDNNHYNDHITINSDIQRAVSVTAATNRDVNLSMWLSSSNASADIPLPNNTCLNNIGIQQTPASSDQFCTDFHQTSCVDNEALKVMESSSVRSNSTCSSLVNVQVRLLKSSMKGLRRLLFPSPSIHIGKSTLIDIYNNRLPIADTQRIELQRSLKDYLNIPDHDLQLCEIVSNTIEDCINWSSEIRQIYFDRGVYKKSQAKILYDSLQQFSKQSEVNVYDFFHRFSVLTEEFDIPEERSELLYNKYLSADLQDEIVEHKHDFCTMKKILIHHYGDLKTVTNDILWPLSDSLKPNQLSNTAETLVYYKQLNSSLQKINNLFKVSDIPVKEAEEYIYSQDFLHLLLSHVPHEANSKFVSEMQSLGEDIVRIKGKTAFKLILSAVMQCYQLYEISLLTEEPQPAGHTLSPRRENVTNINCVHTINSSVGSDKGESDITIKLQEKSKKSLKNFTTSPFKFPCILENHNHQMSECKEFFLASPRKRIEARKQFKFKHCRVCLQSSEFCTSKSCKNLQSIPVNLICGDCKDLNGINKKRPCFSVLFCLSERHIKPSNLGILQGLEEYIPRFKSSFPKDLIRIYPILNI